MPSQNLYLVQLSPDMPCAPTTLTSAPMSALKGCSRDTSQACHGNQAS